jgi:predicted metal-binding transcription factor (methanogenesis marker protein 9)
MGAILVDVLARANPVEVLLWCGRTSQYSPLSKACVSRVGISAAEYDRWRDG